MIFDSQKILNAQHLTLPHSLQLSPLKNIIATASADGRINLFTASDLQLFTTTLIHTASIYKLAWAPPQYGTILASAGFDGRVCIFKLVEKQLIVLYQKKFDSPVHSIDWCPSALSLILAAASQNGQVDLIKLNNTCWKENRVVQKSKSVFPTFVNWGKVGQNGIFSLAVGQKQSLTIYFYKEEDERFYIKKQISTPQIVDLSWQHALFSDEILIVLSRDLVQFYDINCMKIQQISTNQTYKDYNLSIGWSQGNSTLNVYCLNKDEFRVKSYVANSCGKYQLLSQKTWK